MPVLTYPDPFLSRFCTDDRETRAFADVDALRPSGSPFADAWRDKLATLRTYVIACTENMADADDTFAAKLKVYEREYTATIAAARAATPNDDGSAFIFSVPLERA